MQRKGAQTSFEVRFTGEGIAPERIPLRILARALAAVQRLVSDDEEDDTSKSGERYELHLLDVKPGSAVYPVFATEGEEVVRRISAAGSVLKNPDKADSAPQVLSPVEELSAIAKSLDCLIEFRKPGKTGSILAKIGPASYESLVGSVFVSGETTISGTVERVGGATELHCGLRVRQQPAKMLICKVEGTEVARQLGQHLYEEVVVQGTATWFRRNWRLKGFVVRAVQQVKRGSIQDAIRALKQAGGNKWDEMDNPQKFLTEVRGE